MDKKTKLWIFILGGFCLLCLLLWLLIGSGGGGTVAVISVDGVELSRIDLSKVTESYDIPIDTEFGSNIVHVEPGRISVSDADCPDGVCVRQGAISRGGVPIVCMPHRLIIEIEGSGIDG